MKRFLAIAGSAILLAGCAGAYDKKGASAEMAGDEARAHIGHVMTGWTDTPDGKGLLPVAIEEAEIALAHAEFAAKKPDDLAWMKTHTEHVMHALAPDKVSITVPGLGYGARKAAEGVVAHIGLAASAEDASDNVKVHAEHVAASAGNTLWRVDAVIATGERVLADDSAARAASRVEQIVAMVHEIIDGYDADGDGEISWVEGEGGLRTAEAHMGFMMKGEKMM